MSTLAIYPEAGGRPSLVTHDGAAISRALAAIGVDFERWSANRTLPDGATQDDILAAYGDQVGRLQQKHGFRSADVIRVKPDHPDKAALRAKFLSEHVHTDFEVRFFVEGRGLFFLHAGESVHAVLCEAGDLISVPTGTRHWFDLGASPSFCAIRLFTTPEGWVANFTGHPIAEGFPSLEAFCQQHAT